ncbi:MAG: insulinase family protein [Treponema sp.]|jgi:zinc protease|nr:insulinase family protein [Treponema sp.]
MTILNSRQKRTISLLAGALVLSGLLLSCATGGRGRAGPAVYPELGKAEDPIPFMEKVRSGILPGGLRYFILENSRPENRAYLTLAVNAGSVLEKDDEQGLAHFVEHMAFNGTVRFPESELVDYLRSLGMRFGPEVNAYTSYDRTVFGIEVPVETESEGGAPVKRVPVKALNVLDDWTRAITFDPKDVDEERLVIMEEYRSRLGAMDRARRQMLPVILGDSVYADRFPIGLPEIIQNAPAERLEAFYRRWYRPDNMALIIVGDFDGAALEAELPGHFPGRPAPEPLNRPQFDLSPPKKGNLETMIFSDPELSFSQINLYYKKRPQPVRLTLEGYRENLMDTLIHRILSIRLDEASQKPDTPYIGAGAGNAHYGASSHYYILVAEPKTGEIEASLRELLREKESMRRFGFTQGEINIAKASLMSDLEQMKAERDRQRSDYYVSGLTEYFLTGTPLPDIEWEYDAAQKLLPGIGVKDIAAQVRDYFEPGDLKVLIFAPEKEKESIPGEGRIRELVGQSLRLRMKAPEETAAAGALVSQTPEAGKIRRETTDGETGARIWELENGATLILKETRNRNNEITLYAMARGGTVSAGADEYVSVSLAPEIAEASGLGPWSRPQLVRLLADKQVNFSFWAGNYHRTFQGSAASKDIGTLFEMLYLSFTEPRIDKDAIRTILDSYRTSLAQREDDPNSVFSDAVNNLITGRHPYFKPLELEDLAKVDEAQVTSFLKRCLNPGDYTFVFTGNLDPVRMRTLAETWLASIPPGEPWNTWTDPGIQRPGKADEKVYKGKEEQSAVYMGWFAPLPFTEEQSVNAMVLSEYLDILFTRDIREKLGGVYSIMADVSLSPTPAGELMMQVYFVCDPRRSGELSATVEALLKQSAGAPLDEDTFVKSVEALKKNWEASIQSNLYIAQSYANSSVLLNSPLSRLDKRPGLFEKVRPADIQALCLALQSAGPAKVTLYPEGWN